MRDNRGGVMGTDEKGRRFAYNRILEWLQQVSKPVDKDSVCIVIYCAQNQKEVVPLCSAKP
jgi:hypothetical protein